MIKLFFAGFALLAVLVLVDFILDLSAERLQKNGVAPEFAWLKGTEWTWNGFAQVRFEVDGSLQASTGECDLPGECHWYASKETVFVTIGDAGLHLLQKQGIDHFAADFSQFALK